jgi:hypothetical protein
MVLIMAVTAGRCLAETWGRALRIQWTRQRCSVVWKTFDAAGNAFRLLKGVFANNARRDARRNPRILF